MFLGAIALIAGQVAAWLFLIVRDGDGDPGP
jgi:hypothetical protein